MFSIMMSCTVLMSDWMPLILSALGSLLKNAWRGHAMTRNNKRQHLGPLGKEAKDNWGGGRGGQYHLLLEHGVEFFAAVVEVLDLGEEAEAQARRKVHRGHAHVGHLVLRDVVVREPGSSTHAPLAAPPPSATRKKPLSRQMEERKKKKKQGLT